MTMTLIADAPVDVDAEGFMTDPGQWNEPIAEAIARQNGVPELTDRHWLVVRFMRERYLSTGAAPSIRALGKESGVPVKELYALFPKGPGEARRQDRRHPQAQGLHLRRSDDDDDVHTRPPRARAPGRPQARDDREGLDRRLEGLPRRRSIPA